MKYFIEQNGKLSKDETKIVRYLTEKNINTISYFSSKQMNNNKIELTTDDVVFGGLKNVNYFFKTMNIPFPESNSYPIELSSYYNRKIWNQTIEKTLLDQKRGINYFVKPRYDYKTFTGCLIQSDEGYKSIRKTLNKYGKDYQVLCSDKIEFLSEYRIYILDGEIGHISHYWGEKTDIDYDFVKKIVLELTKNKMFLNTVLDVGKTKDGFISVIEHNAFFSVDSYDCPYDIYAKILINGWNSYINFIKSITKN